MADASKHHLLLADLKSLFSIVRTGRRIKLFAYGFMLAFVACTVFIAFSPNGSSSPWYNRIFPTSSPNPYNSQLSSFFSFILPYDRNSTARSFVDSRSFPGNEAIPGEVAQNRNTSSSVPAPKEEEVSKGISFNVSSPFPGEKANPESENAVSKKSSENRTKSSSDTKKEEISVARSSNVSLPVPGEKGNTSSESAISGKIGEDRNGNSSVGIAVARSFNASSPLPGKKGISEANKAIPGKNTENRNTSASFRAPNNKEDNVTAAKLPNATISSKGSGEKPLNKSSDADLKLKGVSNYTASWLKGNGTGAVSGNRKNGSLERSENRNKGGKAMVGLKHCDIFEGRWVKDDSYPLYKEGSCPHIDEPFDCFLNGRPDRNYQKLRWQPNDCNIPRLNAADMLERLRGKRLVFVGDSLNRNMWESLVCVLRNSVKDKRKVFEASGRREFRTEGSYSFVFKDYNCSVEFFRSPFLVQEWENPEPNGKSRETLRLDLIERSSSKYKNADFIIFNTGHWWTHEKTSKGKDYYQEGSHIYGELNVGEAFRKALTTWARWVDANINPEKTLVFFRGYSASHFSGGRWNSGGACDKETEPIKNETYLGTYPPKMSILERVMKGMKTPVNYLNITRMTDYRKDAHPSVYRKKHLSDEERKSPERFQDCSHWCLPGVPDTWNELLYAQLIIKQQRH
ncbi:hypothetical protein AAC387_Pa01g1437 [Persea americana]